AKGREELSKDFPPCSGSPCPDHLHFAVKVSQVARSCISHHEAQIPGFTAHPFNLVLPCLKERYEALSLLAEYLHSESIPLDRVVKGERLIIVSSNRFEMLRRWPWLSRTEMPSRLKTAAACPPEAPASSTFCEREVVICERLPNSKPTSFETYSISCRAWAVSPVCAESWVICVPYSA